MAFIFSCSSGGDGNGGGSKSDCIEKELKIGANTLDDVAKACNAIRSEVLSQLSDNVGSCNKNDLSFDKSIGDIKSDCGVAEIPVINPSSSSNSNGGSGNFNPSDLPKQLYVSDNYGNKEPFNGNGEIVLIFEGQDEYNRYFSDTLSAGKIQNGQVVLDLPNIDGKYLKRLKPDMCDFWVISGSNDYNYPCESDVFYPRNLAGYYLTGELRPWLTGKGLCDEFYLIPTEEDAIIMFIYFSESGKITGTARLASERGTTIFNYDMNISKGWNIVWGTNVSYADDAPCGYPCEPKPYEPYYQEGSYYTSSKSLKNFEWKTYCRGN
jgi:hypothetical protein